MKRTNLWASSLALGLALACSQFTPVMRAQTPSQDPNAQQQQDQHKSQTFVGQVVKARNGQFALLTDKQAGKGFFLDDQEKAKQFEGQYVKVIGTLDVASNLIHVTNITAA